MRRGIAGFMIGTLVSIVPALHADDLEHQKKEAREAQAKADKAQAKADKEAGKYDEESYRRYVKARNKEEKEWSKLDAREREDYYKWLKKHKH